ncbi:unnamed protein product, partial [Polarella glacialis]
QQQQQQQQQQWGVGHYCATRPLQERQLSVPAVCAHPTLRALGTTLRIPKTALLGDNILTRALCTTL